MRRPCPPQPPSLTSSDPQVRWLASGLGPGQTADEVLRFLGPPSPNLCCLRPRAAANAAPFSLAHLGRGNHLASRRRRVLCQQQFPIARASVEPGPCPEPSRSETPLRRLPGRRGQPHFPKRNPVVPKTPAVAQAARWWPRGSSGRPHRQSRSEGGIGNQRRHNKRTRKKLRVKS